MPADPGLDFLAILGDAVEVPAEPQTGQPLEVCDPVENYTYSIDGVDDFTLPSGLVGIRRPR